MSRQELYTPNQLGEAQNAMAPRPTDSVTPTPTCNNAVPRPECGYPCTDECPNWDHCARNN